MVVALNKIESLYATLLKDSFNKHAIVFGVEDKRDFINISNKGKAFYSQDILFKSISKLSHFTPNTYKQPYGKMPENRLYGFTEQNLKHINTFVIDIDNLSYSLQDILLACIDHSIGAPTMVVRTPNGYQVHFILSKSFNISSTRNYHSLNVAKRISLNLKNSLASVEADRYCNDFGFFRVPTQDNIVWLQLNETYAPKEMIYWSEKMDDNKERSLYTARLNPSNRKTPYLETNTFKEILSLTTIKGHSGKIGRNNTIFTIALACYADGLSKTEAAKLISKFNNQLEFPIKMTEVQASIRSAYSGRYNGPDKQYINQILEGQQVSDVKTSTWYKFKKDRADRTYSHLHEWENDIVNYLESQELNDSPYIRLTQKQLCKEIGCQQSTLNTLLNKSTKIFKVVIGKGRAAITKWSTINILIKFLALQYKAINSNKLQYKKYVQNINNTILTYGIYPELLLIDNTSNLLNTS